MKLIITEQQFEKLVNNILDEDIEKQMQNRIEKIKKQFPKIKWEEKNRYIPDNPLIDSFVKADPSKILEYLPWIIRQYNNILKGKITGITEEVFLEDLYKIKEYLELFNKVKHKLSAEQQNINNYKTYKDLYDVIKQYMEKEEIKFLSKRQQQELIKNREANVIYNGNKWIIVHPKSEAASCLYGKGSQWCTAADRSNNQFNSYNSHGNLYYTINKQKPEEKYAFFFDHNEENKLSLFNSSDSNITDKVNDIFNRNKELIEPFIEIGKKERAFRFLLTVGFKEWINYIDKNSTSLNLENLNLTQLSDKIGLLTNLGSLNLSNNELTTIPETISNLKNLIIFNLSKNKLKNLPDNLENLKNLEEITLGENEFQIIPPVIAKMAKLERLYLTNNINLKIKPQDLKIFSNLKDLRYLSLRGIKILKKDLDEIKKLLPKIKIKI